MDAVKFLKEFYRMCDRYINCIGCPIKPRMKSLNFETCQLFQREHSDLVVACVRDWSATHPQKTKLDDMKEKFPKSYFTVKGGYPTISPSVFGYCGNLNCGGCEFDLQRREKCWDMPLEE